MLSYEDCLAISDLTEDEIEHWRSGGEFPDPWPADFVARS